MRVILLLLELLVLGLSLTKSCCHGRRRGFHQIRRFWQFRGGDSSPDYENGQRYEGQNFPPDLPNYGGEDTAVQRQEERNHYNPQNHRHPGGNYQYHSQQQHEPYLEQQNHQSAPHLPPESYGIDHDPPPLPSNYHRNNNIDQRQYPSLPGDSSLFIEEEPENAGIDTSFGDGRPGDNQNDAGGMDLSSFDKEYILKGLARLYRKKILPLEISSRYGHFHSPPLSPADFVAPPQILLLGQYR